MEEDPARDLMVPLQEALLMNDASTRRELMMDILYDDVGEYVEVLKNARMKDVYKRQPQGTEPIQCSCARLMNMTLWFWI